MSIVEESQTGGFVGRALKRKEDPRLITGRATYTDDMTRPGMLHAAIVRSPEAHARTHRHARRLRHLQLRRVHGPSRR